MALQGIIDNKDDGRGNQPLNNLIASGSRAQTENDGRKEEQKKAETWLKIGWVLTISTAFIFLVSISAFTTSVTLMAVLIVAVAALVLVWNVAFGILSIPSLEAWIIESRGIFLRVAVKSPTVLPLRGFITHIAQKISMKEIVGKDIFGDRKLRLESTLIGVEADITYKVQDFYKFYYSVKAEKGKPWKETMNDLIWAITRDALQTYASTEGPDGGPHTLDTIVQIKGANLSGKIFASDNDKYREIRENFERWGIEIVTLIFGDFEESDEDMKLKKDVLDAEQKQKIAEIGIKTGRMLGQATAERIKAATWEMAKDYAGIRKKDENLSAEEIKRIATFVPAARSDYLESLSVESTIKSPGKMIITEGSSVGKLVGRDAAREAVRQEMSKEQGEPKDQGEKGKKGEQKVKK